MKNLEQIRARNALKCQSEAFVGGGGGEVIKKISPYVINHGLLASAAFALDKKISARKAKEKGKRVNEEDEGYGKAFDRIAEHLADPDIKLLDPGTNTCESLLEQLTKDGSTSQQLRECTNEAMAWLNFARRFIS